MTPVKLMHISDLHLGRQLHRFPLQDEQNVILELIRQTAEAEKPDAILIAGDVYDRSIPPVYATQSLDIFLQGLLATGAAVCMISGNHDSPERLSFGAQLLSASGVHVARNITGAE